MESIWQNQKMDWKWSEFLTEKAVKSILNFCATYMECVEHDMTLYIIPQMEDTLL